MDKIYKDLKYSDSNECILDIYATDKSNKTIVYIHGGGLESSDKTSFHEIYEFGISVISINYRMYPSAKYPDFLEDSAIALKWVYDNSEKYKYGNDIYIFGSSAGAYIAMMLCFDNKWLAFNGLKSTDFAGFIYDSPQPTDHFNVLREKGIDIKKVIIDEYSPLFYVEEKVYPPMMIVTYQNDILGRLEQNKMASKLLEAYKIPHEFYVFEGCHCSGEILNENGDFLLNEPLLKFVFKKI